MIEYDDVTKVFGSGSSAVSAVDSVTFAVEKGQLVTLLGPSGCGKTTLLRLTNRLISLTRGQIRVNGTDITTTDPAKLRQSMGYAIQAVGLFPNKTIYGNIATVPKLLGWGEDRIRERAKELLRMLRLDPEEFLDRYPAELSGGQQQRIGVARCLAADPEILLMDEPFGAIDPINREEIQNEFLNVQATLKKTILFVTHDIHEALKMGDRIAILDRGKLIQYDTPERILTQPKNAYIADFVGADRALKVLGLLKATEAMIPEPNNVLTGTTSSREARKFLDRQDLSSAVVLEHDRPVGYVLRESLENAKGPVRDVAASFPEWVGPGDRLRDVMSRLLMHDIRSLPVVGEDGRFQGLVTLDSVQRSILQIYRKTETEETG
jgi:osmoprotectant transport system ATP-binding protein